MTASNFSDVPSNFQRRAVQPLYPNKEKYCIAPPREDNVHLLDRGGVPYDPTRTSHSIGGLRQRKNKHGAETHVFVLAGAGKFSTIID